MQIFRIISTAALVLVVGSAFAHKGMHGPGAKFDVDGSQDLSLDEYVEYLKSEKQDVSKAAEQFARLDQDKNGALSSGEFLAGLSKEGTKSGQ